MTTKKESLITKLPLFNRIVIFVISLGYLVGMAVVALTPRLRKDIDWVDGILSGIVALLACLGVWLSLAWRNRTEEQLEEEASARASLFDEPTIADDALASRFNVVNQAAAVHLDVANGKIHFHRCHVPRKFLSSAETWFTCDLKDLQALHVFRYRGESLTIVTAQGKALVPEDASNYIELKTALKQEVPYNRSGYSRDHPLMGMVYLAGALIGMFVAAAVCPRNASETAFGLFFIFGATLGVAGSYLLVAVGDQFRVALAQPIGFGVFGGVFGVGIGAALQPVIGGSLGTVIVIAVVGALFGVILGIVRQRKERPPHQSL